MDNFNKQPTVPPFPSRDRIEKLPIPKKVGPYTVENLLDKGSTSILYLGTHPETNKPIVIKVLSPTYVSHPESIQRFLNEAEIISMTDHPNIVKLYGHGEWEGGLYIAMEFIEGISLKQYFLQHLISLKRALEIILDIAYALCHLHTHGVIHRDLKPDNILITGSGQIKVIDFGIAQVLDENVILQEGPTKRLIGTPVYMSPEQRSDPESVSYPSDIYSLGIIAYELVLGKLSHGQIHLGLMPKGLQKILNKALQSNPEDRYKDIVDFISDISEYLHSATLEKEKKTADQASELYEGFQKAQKRLMFQPPPEWPEIEVFAQIHYGMGLTSHHYEFLSFPSGGYGFTIGESSAKGPLGALHASVIRGMIQSIQNPDTLLNQINDVLSSSSELPPHPLLFLYFLPNFETFEFCSCGYGSLWRINSIQNKVEKITSNNIALGLSDSQSFKKAIMTWGEGDLLLINPLPMILGADKTMQDELINDILRDTLGQPPEKIFDALILRARMQDPREIEEHSFCLAAFQRRLK